jgi:hypothetical protein
VTFTRNALRCLLGAGVTVGLVIRAFSNRIVPSLSGRDPFLFLCLEGGLGAVIGAVAFAAIVSRRRRAVTIDPVVPGLLLPLISAAFLYIVLRLFNGLSHLTSGLAWASGGALAGIAEPWWFSVERPG